MIYKFLMLISEKGELSADTVHTMNQIHDFFMITDAELAEVLLGRC